MSCHNHFIGIILTSNLKFKIILLSFPQVDFPMVDCKSATYIILEKAGMYCCMHDTFQEKYFDLFLLFQLVMPDGRSPESHVGWNRVCKSRKINSGETFWCLQHHFSDAKNKTKNVTAGNRLESRKLAIQFSMEEINQAVFEEAKFECRQLSLPIALLKVSAYQGFKSTEKHSVRMTDLSINQ